MSHDKKSLQPESIKESVGEQSEENPYSEDFEQSHAEPSNRESKKSYSSHDRVNTDSNIVVDEEDYSENFEDSLLNSKQ